MAGMFDDLIPAQAAAPAPPQPAPAAASAAGPTQNGMFDDLVPVPPDQQIVARGDILPISRDAAGGVHFDSNAGILGALKSAFTLPGDVYTGKVDPSSPEGMSRAASLAATITPVSPMARMGAIAAGALGQGSRPATAVDVTPPTVDALKAAASGGYDTAREMGVDYNAQAVANLAAAMKHSLEQDGVLAELAPKTHAILDKLQSPPADATVPFGSLDAARRAFGLAAKDFGNPTEQMAAKRAMSGVDDFVVAPSQSAVDRGPAQDVAQIISDARGNYAAAKRAERLSGVAESVDLRAAATNSGQNIGNTIRQRAASILGNPKASAGFSQDELIALEDIARGTPSQNASRYIGNLLGGGGGMGALITGALGHHFAGPAGFAVPALGVVAKKASNAMTSSALDRLIEQTAARSPLMEQMVAAAPAIPTQNYLVGSQPTLLRLMTANGLLPQSMPAYSTQ